VSFIGCVVGVDEGRSPVYTVFIQDIMIKLKKTIQISVNVNVRKKIDKLRQYIKKCEERQGAAMHLSTGPVMIYK